MGLYVWTQCQARPKRGGGVSLRGFHKLFLLGVHDDCNVAQELKEANISFSFAFFFVHFFYINADSWLQKKGSKISL